MCVCVCVCVCVCLCVCVCVCVYGASNLTFEHISYIFLVFLLPVVDFKQVIFC